MANAALLPITVNARMGLYATPEKIFGARYGQLGEAASSTWKIGAPLVNSSGYLAEAGTNPTAIVGFATAAATGVTGADVAYIPAFSDVLEWEASIDKASAQAGALALLANTDVFSRFGLTKDSGGIWYVDIDKTGTTYINFRLMGFKQNPNTNLSDASVVNGRGIFNIVRTSSVTVDGTIYF